MCASRASASTSSGCEYSRSIRSRTRRSRARWRRRSGVTASSGVDRLCGTFALSPGDSRPVQSRVPRRLIVRRGPRHDDARRPEGGRMDGHGTSAPSELIVYIDHSDIRAGAIDELRAGVRRLVEFIDAREPRLITYGFYIDEDAQKMTVVAVHPDSASLELHMDVGGEEFRKLGHLLRLTGIQCYGRPSERALHQL